jgi:hypothetical protein
MLARIQSLTAVGLDGTAITDTGLARLATMPRLKAVYVSGTGVTADAIEAFEKSSPGRHALRRGLNDIPPRQDRSPPARQAGD